MLQPKRIKISSLEYSDTDSDWLSSGEEWTPNERPAPVTVAPTSKASRPQIAQNKGGNASISTSKTGKVMAIANSEQGEKGL